MESQSDPDTRPAVSDRIGDFFRDHERVTAALTKGVRKALLEHKKLGHSIAVWKDGKVVVLPPEAIPVDDDA